MTDLALILVSVVLGALVVVLGAVLLRRKARAAPVSSVSSQMVAERVRAVGKLVGLEVHAKEIATSTKGWSWLPPIILSQAKIAMIFHFEKQYSVDLARLRPGDVEVAPEGGYVLHLPAVQGALRLTDVTPYDIQAGRVLGLIDVIQMNAATQKELIAAAQEQAAALFHSSEARYVSEARHSVERQLESLLRLFDTHVTIAWREPAHDAAPSLSDTLGRRLAGATSA